MARRSSKRPKDPNAPKRAMSSYFLFSNARRPKLREQYPEKKITDISKLISVEWKELDEDARKPYVEEAAAAKAKWTSENDAYKMTSQYVEYQEKLKQWKAEQKEMNGNGSPKRHSRHGKTKFAHRKPPPKPKDPNAPKRPYTSYFLFTAEKRAEAKAKAEKEAALGSASASAGASADAEGGEKKEADKSKTSVTEMSKVLGAEWKEMIGEGQQPYIDRAKVLKREYEEKLKVYNDSDEAKAFQEKMAEWKAKCAEVKKYNLRQDRKRREAEEESSDEESSSSSDEDDDDSSSSSGSTSESSSSSSSSG